jgi:galactose mutarotase-like enzyme
MAHTETKHDNPVIDRAGDDEPLFVLRARDALCVETIQHWINAARHYGVSDAKLLDAAKHQQLILYWQAHNGCKIPD